MENVTTSANQSLEIWGHSIRWYIDQAEKSSLILAGFVLAIYVATFWLEMSYLGWLSPSLMFILIASSIIYTYFLVIKKNFNWREGFIVTGLMGFVFGLQNTCVPGTKQCAGMTAMSLEIDLHRSINSTQVFPNIGLPS